MDSQRTSRPTGRVGGSHALPSDVWTSTVFVVRRDGGRHGLDGGRVLPALMAIILAAVAPGCRSREAPTPSLKSRLAVVADAGPAWNVLLVTLDTTRADRLGCYGYSRARTPVIDRLAAEGVLFENALAAAPMTLPSHATIMTGADPPEHGLRVNGVAALGPELPTLAEAFRTAGYATAAFVGAYVLDSRYGLDRGFDVYDDEMEDAGGAAKVTALLERQRRGDAVSAAALAWLNDHCGRPFFCWVHYFDPHHPYDPPAPFDREHPDPYDGEIAYTDTQVGRLVQLLEAEGVADRTLIVVAGDHGESLGEHGEKSHALFIYESVMRVPLVFRAPGVFPAGYRCRTVVGLCDVCPTILSLFGWEPGRPVRGRSLDAALAGGSPIERAYYGESEYPFQSYGWSPLRSVTRGRWRYIQAPRRELYDRAADPGELENLAEARAEVCEQLDDELEGIRSRMASYEQAKVKLDASEVQALAALGYIVAGAGAESRPAEETLRDPKDMVDILRASAEAQKLKEAGRLDGAIGVLQRAVARSPESYVLYQQLSEVCIRAGRFQEALEPLLTCMRMRPRAVDTLSNLGSVYSELGEWEKAIEHYRVALTLDPESVAAHAGLSLALAETGDAVGAIEHARRVVELSPASGAYQVLAQLYLRTGRTFEAIESLREALRLEPRSYEMQHDLGKLLAAVNDLAGAEAALREASRLRPGEPGALLAVARVQAQRQRWEDAAATCEAVLQRDPSHGEALMTLADVRTAAGQPQRAIELLLGQPALQGDRELRLRLHSAYVAAGRYSEARGNLEAMLREGLGDVRVRNSLAWLLATCADASIRDGKAAVRLAQEALKENGREEAWLLDTLAAAYAERGDFDEAARTARRAIELARVEGRELLAEDIRVRLAAYERRRAHREAGAAS